jgi:hypothetical protein
MAARYTELFCQIFPLWSDVSFTLVVNTRAKILKIYSRFKNEGKNYARSTLKSRCRLWNVSVIIAANGLRAGDRSPVLRLRQGYGACTLL